MRQRPGRRAEVGSGRLLAGREPVRSGAETSRRLSRLARSLAEEPDRYFDAVGVSSAAARAYLLANNDLAPIVAALQGMADSPEEIDLGRLASPILLYSGSADPAAGDVRETAADRGPARDRRRAAAPARCRDSGVNPYLSEDRVEGVPARNEKRTPRWHRR